MSKRAEEAALKAYPVHEGASPQWIKHHLSGGDCAVFIQGYEQAEKDIITLIESRLSELFGDAQPTPILRYELQDLIKIIKEEEK